MRVGEITLLFEEPDSAHEYLEAEGLAGLLAEAAADPDRLPLDYRDLARLHRVIRARRVFTVLEFGIGCSTLVMADALLKNRQVFAADPDRPPIRNHTPFQLHTVDASPRWIAALRAIMPPHLAEIVTIHPAEVAAGTFQDRPCHFYTRLPDVVPDLIYLDGPDPADVRGDVAGLSWANPDRVVLAGDLLRLEPTLLPGAAVIIDGRTTNARFLERLLFRNWVGQHAAESDFTVMELQDRPLGRLNRATLRYCLGERVDAW